LALGLAIVGIVGPVVIHPVGGVLVSAIVIVGTVGHLIEYARTKDSVPDPSSLHASPWTPTAPPVEPVHVAGALGLIVIMVVWMLIVLRQFIAALALSVLLLMFFGGRLAVDWLRYEFGPRRPFDDFEDKVRVQTVFILLITGALFLIAGGVVMAE
jgi:hypothetical protein